MEGVILRWAGGRSYEVQLPDQSCLVLGSKALTKIDSRQIGI